MNFVEQLDGKNCLVIGAGVTGRSVHKALLKYGAASILFDENKSNHQDVVNKIPIDIELAIVSPGWRQDHKVFNELRKSGAEIMSEIDFAWKVQTILDENLQAEDIIYQTVTQNTQYRFMLYCNNHIADLNTLVETANDIVYKQLDQFNILSVKNQEAIIFSTGVYKYSIFHGTNILEDTSNYTFI